MTMTMTMKDVDEIMADPEYAGRAMILVVNVGTEDNPIYETTYEERTFTATNIFALDSNLTYAGVPEPRNLFLVHASEVPS